MLDGMEELTLQVSYLIQSKSYFKGFPVIKYTYVPCLKIAMLCVIALCGLILFMVHWARAYSELCQLNIYDGAFCGNSYLQRSNLFAYRRLSSEYTSADCKVNCFASFWFILQLYLKRDSGTGVFLRVLQIC